MLICVVQDICPGRLLGSSGGLAGWVAGAGSVISTEVYQARHHLYDTLALHSDCVQQCGCEMLKEVFSPLQFSKANGGYGGWDWGERATDASTNGGQEATAGNFMEASKSGAFIRPQNWGQGEAC